ncbi:GPW/gp25 family protein [Microbacterium sp. SS28]|uniref:GPW/gp25 family protein n=1 Tax=Microbacterium sp. SS28 TaxID=2919948 RepID=UPI001FAA9CE6|nr:GPW/gp25 family protein [Microbacterium sp. SS28]
MSGTLDYPWSVDGTGRTSTTGRDEHVRDLIEQVLLTSPGERVMRPDFGAGLLAQVFAPGGPEVAAASQFLVQAALERELADVIALESVDVEARDAAVVATVAYVVRATGAHEVQTFRTPPGVSS